MRRKWMALLLTVPLWAAAESEQATPVTSEQVARDVLELEVRQAALQLLADDAERKLAELTRLREEMQAALAPREEAAGEELATLIQFYQAMKAKKAAVLLEKLPPQLAADVLAAMKTRQAGKILDVMVPERAVRVSKLMAGRSR